MQFTWYLWVELFIKVIITLLPYLPFLLPNYTGHCGHCLAPLCWGYTPIHTFIYSHVTQEAGYR